MIALEDLKGLNEDEIKEHLATVYSKRWDDYDDIERIRQLLNDLEVIIAYESVGSYGCDSSSFFLLKNRKTGVLSEIHGSHCSCYGFEEQFVLEETTIEALKYRRSKDCNIFYCGGYDDNETENQKIVNDYIDSVDKL